MIAMSTAPESGKGSDHQIDFNYGGNNYPGKSFADETSGPAGNDAAEGDDLLVRRAKTNPAAFGSLYDRYFPAIYRYAYRRLGNQPDAEDVASQTFCLAWANFERYEWRGVPFVVWLYRIATNVVVDSRRRRKQMASLDEALEVPDGAPSPADLVEEAERKALLIRAVQSLPVHQQRAIIYRYGGELSNAEVGALMGRTESAIKQLVHRGVASLRKRSTSEEMPLLYAGVG